MVSLSLRICLVFALIGCSSDNGKPKTVKVLGTVRYKKSEIPEGALVVFHAKDPAFEKKIGGKPLGKVAADGTFQLTTYEENDGAPPGEYGVTVEWRPTGPKKESKMSLGSEGGPVSANKLHHKYGNPAQPFKTVTINAGENKVELEVD